MRRKSIYGIVVLVLLFGVAVLMAQTEKVGRISGQLLDKETGAPA